MSFTHYDLQISAVTQETADAVSISFADPQGYIQYLPGQFLTLELDIAGKHHRRAYSMCSTPGLDVQPTICVKKVEGGLISPLLVSQYKAGDTMRVFTAIGNFTFQPKADGKRHVVLIGAGSGITPLLSIAKATLAQEPGSQVSLVYGNRTEESIIFSKQLDALAARYPGRLRTVHTLTSPPAGWAGQSGRITGDMVVELLYHLAPLQPASQTLFYLCGPQAMAEQVEQALIASGNPRASIFRESFFSDSLPGAEATVTAPAATIEASGPYQVKILLDGSEYLVDVPEGTSILEAALDQDVDMPYSCQAGLCTACRGKCLSGAIQMDETEGLSDSEIAAGYVLTCVGHPKAHGTVVEIG